MLVGLYMKNFKSFMEETNIDLNATGYEILNDTNKNKQNILKGALIVGGNATGKSTVLSAIRFLLELLVWQVNITPIDYVCLFNESEAKTILKYQFLINNSQINYELEINAGKIYKEKVEVDKKIILSRMKESAEYITANNTIELDNLQENQSAIRKVYFDTKFIDNTTLKMWFKFLEDSIYIDQSEKKIQKAFGNSSQLTYFDYFDKNGTEELNKFLEKINYTQYAIYTGNYNKLKKVKFFRNEDKKDIVLERKDFEGFGLPLDFESIGNKTLIRIVPFILEAIKNDAMVIIDEFSSAFHNSLEEKIIKFFMENSNNSQLFLVSHSTNLLSNTLLRPDQIYTVDFIEKKGSKLYRVSDSKPREAQNLEKMYLSGVFNGLPNIK